MSKRKLYIRADANSKIGYGHFIRSLALADILKESFEITFFTSDPNEYQKKEINKICQWQSLKENTKFADFLDILEGNEIVILDNYFYSTQYQIDIKNKGCKLVCIDDPHGIYYVCDLLIGHGFCLTSDFNCSSSTIVKTGIEWTLLRKPFLCATKFYSKRNNDIVINFGGADPFHDTEKIVGYILNLKLPYNIKVILGDTTYLSESKRSQVSVLHNLDASQMASLFDLSAFGIFTASTVCLEGLSRGLPMLVGYDIENQLRGYQLMKSKNIISPLGNLLNIKESDVKKAIHNLQFIEKFYVNPERIIPRYLALFKQL